MVEVFKHMMVNDPLLLVMGIISMLFIVIVSLKRDLLEYREVVYFLKDGDKEIPITEQEYNRLMGIE